jgi:pimeloyl-ACP methyl ester carboxylesterase
VAERIAYDEFSFFHENAAEYGLPFTEPPHVSRVRVEVEPGRALSALRWGSDQPELVLLHGGAQNAHTWDTVALALGRPLIAIDLPGHGHSDGPGDHPSGQLSAAGNAADVAAVIRQLAPDAAAVVGMSLGGLTAIALTEVDPSSVRRLVLVDITPGVTAERANHITSFVHGPASFPSFEDLLARTKEFNPTRSESSLRRGILHNALQREDGTWVWRHARSRTGPWEGDIPDNTPLWETISRITVPVMLCRGMRGDSVIGDDDEQELRRRLPDVRVERFEHAGHSIQGDMPLELAAAIQDFVP